MALRWYHPGFVIAYIDLFPIYSPLILLQKSVWAWGHMSSPFGNFDLPTYSTYYLLDFVLSAISNAGIAEVLLFWIFIATQWVGAFALCRSLGIGILGSFVAAWAYALSPFEQFLVGFTTGSAYAAALPWVFWMLHRAAADERSRPAMTAWAAAACLLVLPWVGSTPQLFFELLLATLIWTLFLIPRAVAGYARWLSLTVPLCIVAASWWLVPEFFALFGNAVVHSEKAGSVAWTFANSSLMNNLRFITPWSWGNAYYEPYSQGYDNNLLTFSAGFWYVVVLAVALMLRRSTHAGLIRFFAAVALASLFVAKGPHPPLEQINNFIYSIPGFFLLIESVGITILAVLSISIVLGIVVDEAERARAASSIGMVRLAALCGVSIVAVLLAASPLLSGLIFSQVSGAVSGYVRLPAYWPQAAAYLNSQTGLGSVLVLPENRSYQAHYDWSYQGVDLIADELIARYVLLLGPPLNYFADYRLEAIKDTLSGMLASQDPHTSEALRTLGIRYVLCRNDVEPYGGVAFHDCHADFLAPSATVARFGEIVVYDLGQVGPDRSIDETTPGKKLIVRQFYNAAWQALSFAPPMLLKHEESGWFNAWIPAGNATVAFNAVNVLELLFAIAGVFIVGWRVRVAVTTKRSHPMTPTPAQTRA
jgi:hypothetical protein